MKMSHFVLIFLCIFLVFWMPRLIENVFLSETAKKQIEYNNAVDNAVDDALDAAGVEQDSDELIFINKEDAADAFFQSLSDGVGIADNPESKEKLKLYVPVMLFTEKDGYYLYYADTYRASDQSSRISRRWSEKRKYVYADAENNLIVQFTLGDIVYIYNKSTKQHIDGHYKDIADLLPDVDYLHDAASFDAMRRACIIGQIKKDMNNAVNAHNSIASRYGIVYQFELPEIKKSDWNRTIDDTGLMVLFQGYPVRGVEGVYYNQYAVGSSRIKKRKMFYITKDADGTLYYHRENCSAVKDEDKKKVYFSMLECAKQGAYPDSCCR